MSDFLAQFAQKYLAWEQSAGYGGGFLIGWLLGCMLGIAIGVEVMRRIVLKPLIAAFEKLREQFHGMQRELDGIEASQFHMMGGSARMAFSIDTAPNADGVGGTVTFEVTDDIIAACRVMNTDILRKLLPVPPLNREDPEDFVEKAMHMLRSAAPVFNPEERNESRKWLDEHLISYDIERGMRAERPKMTGEDDAPTPTTDKSKLN